MNALLLITAFLATVTIREIVQAVSEHVKAKDKIKVLKATEEAEFYHRALIEKEKQLQEAEKMNAEAKTKLAESLSGLNAEQLAAYNHEMVQYVPAPAPVPPWTLFNQQQGITQWRGW